MTPEAEALLVREEEAIKRLGHGSTTKQDPYTKLWECVQAGIELEDCTHQPVFTNDVFVKEPPVQSAYGFGTGYALSTLDMGVWEL